RDEGHRDARAAVAFACHRASPLLPAGLLLPMRLDTAVLRGRVDQRAAPFAWQQRSDRAEASYVNGAIVPWSTAAERSSGRGIARVRRRVRQLRPQEPFAFGLASGGAYRW